MRIIAGKYRSRKLYYPKDRSIRPTMDRVKESLFSTLGDSIEGKSVLSLFAGSGSLGFEAISRGASKVTFVDLQPISIESIQKNILMLRLAPEETAVYQEDALFAIERFARGQKKFDFIFLDPPYYQDFIRKTLMKLGAFDILTRFSRLVIEHSKQEPVPEEAPFQVLKSKKYGQTCISICSKSEKEIGQS